MEKNMLEPERFKSPAYNAVLDRTAATQVCRMDHDKLQQMRDHCSASYPAEACGLLAGYITATGWQVDKVYAVPNLNTEEASDRFQLDPDAYREIDRSLSRTDREIIGIYHSHPDCPARPSPTDLDNAWEAFAYIIVSVHQDAAVDVRCWTLNCQGDKFQPVSLKETA